MAKYSLVPEAAPPVETRYRRICTPLPVPESLPIFRSLEESESPSMMGQPPIVWHRADGFQVFDRWGNCWVDWSSGVIIANAGHGRAEIREALREVIDRSLLLSYCFVHEQRAELCRELAAVSPDPAEYRVFLLSTGSEACENTIKLARTWGLNRHGPRKRMIIGFENAFHGRTLGAQLAGGMQGQKKWIVGEGSTFAQVPFPDGYYCEDTSFDLFLKCLEEKNIAPEEIAGVISESFQGAGANFMPVEYAQRLEAFCRQHDIVLIMDEVQAGFGRSGKMFSFEHYGIKPDLIACGKGITSSLPLSAVIGRQELMSLYPAGAMTSTHSASPLPVAAALANLRIIQREGLVENSRRLGEILHPELQRIRERYPDVLGCVHGKGLVAGIMIAVRGSHWTPDPDTALRLNWAVIKRGVMMTAPVGTYGECHKVAPPLMISEEALRESIGAYAEACDEVLG
jgi:4-aminobutyrate aminotransferase / (S)-3-amino-2-methylpropionate transaminase / 5-aminovalerate transaminase